MNVLGSECLQPVGPGVWSGEIGIPQGLTPLDWIGKEPLIQALNNMGEAELPFALDDLVVEQMKDCTILRMPLLEDEPLYGLGLQFLRMNHRGRTRYLRVNSDPKQDTGETHAPVPFLVSARGYGIMVDTSNIVTFHCGSTIRRENQHPSDSRNRNTDSSWKATLVSRCVEIRLPSEGCRVLLFAGPTVIDAVRRYNLWCGGGTLPPRWGLGFWHRVPKLYTDEETIEEAEEFRRRGFPCDVIGLEPGWHSRSYPVTYEWSHELFRDPASFVKRMEQQGFRINLWEHPYVSPEAKQHARLEPYAGSHTVWGGLVPDYTLPEAQHIYKMQHEEEHLRIGVSGYKHDECDGSELTNHAWMFPAHAAFPSGHDGEQIRQLYGLLFQKMSDDMYRKHNRRTYGLVRASNAAASSMPYVLYSDLYDHRQFVRALCSSSFSGLLWSPEVRKANDQEDWVRRMQTVCFSPLAMLNAWGDGTKPWSYPEVEGIIRHYLELRMRLLPYLYTAFARYRFEGIPPFRAMPLVEGYAEASIAYHRASVSAKETLNTSDAAYGRAGLREWDDQYAVGDDLLVAPLFAGESSRDVLLPSGGWYGFETGEYYEGGQVVRITCGLEQIPVFVREGAVIPMMPAITNVPHPAGTVPVEWCHFGDVPGVGLLYDDDGETFDYETGQCSWVKAKVYRDDSGSWSGMQQVERTVRVHRSYFHGETSWKFGLVRI
ncbi:ABC transporter substrate-binding protein [Paenibacillus sp. SYP-B3998]|uniref:ABC transporter substrate-binding protein n=1 Tax=Paenibacillus sp. SYP-B3998 TaxID=2678564 RepID=A0A6G3ZU86_9BACL|nr:TIM-barrel domain-containing protein [Paenibacillus sp. SYP-B3998]NEW05773.1 ABC transporter substrate-binding protein [Paenibacillus sp. SYP-B3998]